jgi:hypothetical protein
MSLYCKRHDQDWPQGTEVTFGPRDEYGITRLPCCEPQAASFTVETNFRKAGPSAQAAKAAAESAKMSDIHRHIWRYLRDNPGKTPGEVFMALNPIHGKKLNTYRARITDLKDEGWIEDSGDRRTTEHETTATVWRVSERKAA